MKITVLRFSATFDVGLAIVRQFSQRLLFMYIFSIFFYDWSQFLLFIQYRLSIDFSFLARLNQLIRVISAFTFDFINFFPIKRFRLRLLSDEASKYVPPAFLLLSFRQFWKSFDVSLFYIDELLPRYVLDSGRIS